MTTQIFTSVVNRPDFVETQYRLFKTFLKDEDWQFNVVDDSMEESITEEFKSVCNIYGIKYYRKPQDPNKKLDNPLAGAKHATETIQWTYDTIIKIKHEQDMVLFCDSDMFLLDEFSIQDYIKDEVIAGSLQIRGSVEYIWNGIMFFNMSKIIDKDIDFSEGMVEGQLTDVGGYTYYYFKKTGIELKGSDVQYPTHYYDIDLQKDAGGYNMELHLNGNFLHYRAATNWHSNWKGSDDPLEKKTKVFNQIVQQLLGKNE